MKRKIPAKLKKRKDCIIVNDPIKVSQFCQKKLPSSSSLKKIVLSEAPSLHLNINKYDFKSVSTHNYRFKLAKVCFQVGMNCFRLDTVELTWIQVRHGEIRLIGTTQIRFRPRETSGIS